MNEVGGGGGGGAVPQHIRPAGTSPVGQVITGPNVGHQHMFTSMAEVSRACVPAIPYTLLRRPRGHVYPPYHTHYCGGHVYPPYHTHYCGGHVYPPYHTQDV